MNGFDEFLQGGTPGEGMGTPWLRPAAAPSTALQK